MRKTKTRLLSLLMLFVMLFGMLPTAYADPVADLDVGEDTEVVNGFGASYATADAEPAEFTIIVPTKLPFAILKDGQTLKATNAAIKNRSNGPVTLDGISAEGKGWAIVPEGTDFNAVPVNSRQLTLKLNNDQVPAALPDTRVGVPMTQADWSSPGADDGFIYGQSDLPFTYDGSFAPQSNASEEAVIAHVIFTIAWKYDDAPFVIGDILDFYTFVILDDGTIEITGVKDSIDPSVTLPDIPAYITGPDGTTRRTSVTPGAFDNWPGKAPRIYSGTGSTGSGSTGSGSTGSGATGAYTTSNYSGKNHVNIDPSTTSLNTPTTTRIKTGLPAGTVVSKITNNSTGGTMSFPGGAPYGVVDNDGYLTTTTTVKYPGTTDYTAYYTTPSGGSTGSTGSGGTPSTQHFTVHYPVKVTETVDTTPHENPVKSYEKRLLIELPVGEKHNGARTYSITSEDPTIAEAYEVEDFVVTNGVYKYWLVPHKEGDVLITIILTDGTMLRDHVMIRNSTTAAKNGNKYTISVPNEYEGKTVKRFVLTDPELADVSVAPDTVVKNGQFEVTVNPKKNGHCDYIVEFTDGTSVRSNSQLYISLSGSGSNTGDGNHNGESTTAKTITKPETTGTVNIGIGEYSNYIKFYNGPSFIYDGQPHFPTFSFAEGTYKLSRTSTAQTAIGKYVTVIEPADGYKWSDGTTDKIACTWEIKSPGTLTKPVTTTTVSKSELAGRAAYYGTNFTYDGKEHFPSFGFPEGSYTLDGVKTAQTEPAAVRYITYIKPANGYTWDDGTTEEIGCIWNIEKTVLPDATVTTAPTARTLTYNGEAQELVNAGTADGGTMQYKLNNGSYSTAVPTATNADSYTVYYKIVGDKNHNDTAEKSVVVTIARKRIAMPTVATFTKDGNTHFPAYNYPAGSVTMSGVTDAQSAVGKYTTTVTPTKNYAWTDGTTDAKTITWEIVKAVSEFEGQEIFGVKWNESSSSTALTRLTTANDPYHLVNTNITTEPVAAIEGSRAGSSPFDSYMPYAGMEQYNIVDNKVVAKRGDANFSNTNGDTMVYIPEFYYKVVQDGTNRYFYLSNHEVDGFEKHPGSGNYVGRYTTASGYVSQSGKAPLVKITRAQARTGSMAKGSNWSQYDFATWQAIQYLYLIEYADWNSQARIGRGYVDNGSNSTPLTAGATNTMSYHTGRPAGTDGRTAVQYRWIENPWGNICQFVDGINFNDRAAYVSSNYKTYADDTTVGYIATEVTLPGKGYIKSFGSSTTAPWALIPSAIGGGTSTYVPDYVYSNIGWRILIVGGNWADAGGCGVLAFNANPASSSSYADVGARLLYHP